MFMNSRIKKSVLPFIVGFIIFILIFHFIGIDRIFGNLLKLNITLYILAILCIFSLIFFWTLRWKLFVEEEGYEVSTLSLLKDLVVGLSINNLTPLAKIGGEPVRAYLLKKDSGMKMRKGFATILAELTMLFIVTISLVVVSIILIPIGTDLPLWFFGVLIPFGVLAMLVFLGIVGIYSGKDIIVKIIKWFGRKIQRLEPYKEKLLSRYKVFQETFRDCLKNKRIFSKALIYAFLAKFLGFLKFLFIFWSLGYPINPVKIIIVMGIGSVIFSLPSTPGSLGVYEGGATAALVLLGVPSDIAGSVVFLDRLVWYWGITAIGSSLGIYYGIDLLNPRNIEELG